MELLTHFELSFDSLLKLISFLFWCTLYLCIALKSANKPAEYSSRIVTLLHGTVASLIGIYQCGITTISASSFNSPNKFHHFLLMLWSWGYFAFDLLWCLASRTENSLMLCHHVSSIIAITLYMKKSHTGCTFGCTMAMLECTNPLLQTRWLLRNEGHEKTWLFTMVEMIYLTMFLFLRGFVGTYVAFKVMLSNNFEADEKLLTVIFYVVSLLFMHEIMGYVSYRYRHQVKHFKEQALSCMQEILQDPCQYIDNLFYQPPPEEPEGFFYHYFVAPFIALYRYIMGIRDPEPRPPGVLACLTNEMHEMVAQVSEIIAPVASCVQQEITRSYQNLVSVATSLQSSFNSDWVNETQ